MAEIFLGLAISFGSIAVPGFALLSRFRSLPLAQRLLLAPIVTFGVGYVVGVWCSLVGVPVVPAVVVTKAVLVLWAGIADHQRIRNFVGGIHAFRSVRRIGFHSGAVMGIVVVGCLFGASVWISGLKANSVVPFNRDAAVDGFVAARINQSDSLKSSAIFPSDAYKDWHVVNFYPVGMHIEVAAIHRISGVSIARSFIAVTLLFSVVLLPVYIFMLVRYLYKDRLVAAVAAFLSQALFLFPYQPYFWGGMPFIVALVMVVPAVLFGVYVFSRATFKRSDPMLLTLVGISLFAVHAPEVFVAFALIVCVYVMEGISGTVLSRLRRYIGVSSAVAIGTLLTLFPILLEVGRGYKERAALSFLPLMSVEKFGGQLITLHAAGGAGQPMLAIATVVGVVVAAWRRLAPSWLIGFGVIVFFTFVSGVSNNAIVRFLNFAFYHDYGRIWILWALFIWCFASLAIVSFSKSVSRLGNPNSAFLYSCVISILVTFAVIRNVFSTESGSLRFSGSVAGAASVGSDQLSAFRYLAVHAKGQRIMTGRSDNSLWMYAFSGVTPLIEIYPLDVKKFDPRFHLDERFGIMKNAALIGSDRGEDALVRQYGIHYIYVEDKPMCCVRPNLLSSSEFGGNRFVKVVFSRGSVNVYEILYPQMV